MPPSAGAWKTIDAEPSPDWGRAGLRSSSITAIGWRAAAAGLTSSPVNGAGTRTGLGLGDGEGLGDGDGLGVDGLAVALADGATEALIEGDGVVLRPAGPELVGVGVAGEQPTSRTATAIASPTRRYWLPRPITRRRIADVSNQGRDRFRGPAGLRIVQVPLGTGHAHAPEPDRAKHG
jgi:hypothetical protein